MAIKGLFGFVLFTDQGSIESVTLFGSEKYAEKPSIPSGLELPAGAWHTVVSLVDDSVLFEVKSGPFDPSLAKELASWAPEEGQESAAQYFKTLKQKCLSELSTIQI